MIPEPGDYKSPTLPIELQVRNGAQGGTRTPTPEMARDFKSLVSTYSTTWAYMEPDPELASGCADYKSASLLYSLIRH